MIEFDCDWTDSGVCVWIPREWVGCLITLCLIDSFQNKMFSALQDEGWEEDELTTEEWTQIDGTEVL